MYTELKKLAVRMGFLLLDNHPAAHGYPGVLKVQGFDALILIYTDLRQPDAMGSCRIGGL